MDPKRYKTKNIRFRGLRKKIVLQDDNGPCPLIAICNHRILRGELTLREDLVSNDSLVHAVYDKVFPVLKDDEVVPMTEEVKKLDKGLNLSVIFGSNKGFEDSNGSKIFRILQIPLYHGWMLHPQEDEHIIKVIGSRSHDQVAYDLGLDQCVLEDVDSSDLGIMDGQQYETTKNFLTGRQLTSFGLSSLQNDMAEDELAILFHDNHFSTIYKVKGNVCSLVTDEGLATYHDWQRLSVTGDGAFMSSDFGSSNRGLDMSKFDQVLRPSYRSRGHQQGPQSAIRHYQSPQSGRSHQQGPKPAKAYGPGSKSTNAFLQQREPHYPPRIVEPKSQPAIFAQSSSSSGETPPTSRRTIPSDLQGKQYAALFTQDQDKELGERFLAFLEGFKTKNGIPYYKGAVAAMNVHRVAEIYVQYGHIKHHDARLAHSISCCFCRVQEHLNDAAGKFVRGFKEFDFKFVGNPTVYISDLPEPRRWMPLKKFFSLPGNEPAVDYDIHCGDVSLTVAKSTLIGRVSCSNLLVKVGRTHNSGYSWDGTFTPDDVMINENLEVDIWARWVHYSTASSQQNDYARCADVLEVCEIDGRLPGFFTHLRSSLINFIPSERYSNTMVRKFQRFVTTHMVLRPPMANLKFIDDIYAIHQTLSPWAKRLLRAVLNNQMALDDWRSIFINNPPNVPDILKRVYDFNKPHSGEASDDAAKPHSGEGCDEAAKLDSGEVSDEAAKPHSGEVSDEAAKSHSDEVSDETALINEEEVRAFPGNIEGMMICTRHVPQHGSEGSKVNGRQSLSKLSELEMVISHFLGSYPAVMERVIYDTDICGKQDPLALEELEEMLYEVLDDYNRAESSYLQFIDGKQVNWMEYADPNES